jgi:hypothetical protein
MRFQVLVFLVFFNVRKLWFVIAFLIDVNLPRLIPVAVDGGGEVTTKAKVFGLEFLQKFAVRTIKVVDASLMTYDVQTVLCSREKDIKPFLVLYEAGALCAS